VFLQGVTAGRSKPQLYKEWGRGRLVATGGPTRELGKGI
jgi:hypothetical protein